LTAKNKRITHWGIPFDLENFPLSANRLIASQGDENAVPKAIHLEIGCGWGEFTRESAQKNPHALYVAIEKKLGRILKSAKEQDRARLTNIRYLNLDLAWFFSGVFSTGLFEKIVINFPDPWPKSRHGKHRFINPDFVAELARISTGQAVIEFVTDNYPYAKEAMEVFEASKYFENIYSPYTAIPEIPGRPVSYFEQIHRGEGAPIYFLVYRKK